MTYRELGGFEALFISLGYALLRSTNQVSRSLRPRSARTLVKRPRFRLALHRDEACSTRT